MKITAWQSTEEWPLKNCLLKKQKPSVLSSLLMLAQELSNPYKLPIKKRMCHTAFNFSTQSESCKNIDIDTKSRFLHILLF